VFFDGSPFGAHRATGDAAGVDEIEWLPPCDPRNFLALWSNFHERAEKENLPIPAFPLYFLKTSCCLHPHLGPIQRPSGFDGAVKFEAELGLVIGRPCFQVSVAEAGDYVFGYTCVNDVTAPAVLNEEPAFRQWTRSKSFPTFGPIGPVIDTDIDPAGLRVQAVLNGELKQNYPVSDMIYSPEEVVSMISQEIVMEPGDVIALGTSVGASIMEPGDRIDVVVEGIGMLSNRYEG
jgi:2-keto-4-pentenoate hydratase/2-oxohepta-3-ene-1,7-dioic acid hydratase in catechol pathway